MSVALYSRQLILRPLNDADADLYCQLYTDAEVMGHIAPPLTPESARRAFDLALAQAAAPSRVGYWTSCLRGSRGGCGLLALIPDQPNTHSAEIGILLLPPIHGKGYGTEALATLGDHAFSMLRLERLWTRHHRANLAVTRMMKTLGFEPGQTQRRDQMRWVVGRDDWAINRSAWRASAKPVTADRAGFSSQGGS